MPTDKATPVILASALGRAGFGAAPGEIARVARSGFPAWVDGIASRL